MKLKQLPASPDAGLLLTRLMLAVVFTFHGSQKLFGLFGGYGIEGTAGFFEQLGMPFPTASVVLAGGTELFGGLALALGIFARPAALGLAGTMFVAAFSAHTGFNSQTGGMEYPLTLAVLSLALAVSGSGRLALRPIPAVDVAPRPVTV
ncbi:MAG: putative oxidoreductase [Planctomycetota bacterium]|jgi:putative oxidoreductase